MVKVGRITALLAGAALLAGTMTGTSAASTSAAPRKTGPITVAYVEVNNNSMLNVGKYTPLRVEPVERPLRQRRCIQGLRSSKAEKTLSGNVFGVRDQLLQFGQAHRPAAQRWL